MVLSDAGRGRVQSARNRWSAVCAGGAAGRSSHSIAATGKQIWSHPVEGSPAERGINYWESSDRSDRRLIFTANSYLQEINARTGVTINTFGKDGRVDLREGSGSRSEEHPEHSEQESGARLREPGDPRLRDRRAVRLASGRYPGV